MIGYGVQQLATAGGPGELIAQRMYPLLLPDKPTLPAATYQGISRVEEQTNDGPTGFITVRLQIDSWGATHVAATALAVAFEALLNGFSGPLPDGANVQNAWLDNQSDYFEQGTRLYRVQQDWMIQFSEA
jgi:hypothetical protein